MSEYKPGSGEGKLPLPHPRSPQHLDDKILAYARDKAPEKRAFPQARWVAGLATASVVVLALFITQPRQYTPEIRTPAPTRDEDTMAVTARTESVKAPATRKKMSRATGQVVQGEKYERLADEPLPEQAATVDTMNAALELHNFTDEQLREKLRYYAQLVEQGEAEKAGEAYQQLRVACPTCSLPDTLAQAMVILHEAEPAPIGHEEPQ